MFRSKQLETWVEAGGLLVRFAGPLLAEAGGDPLLPIPLRGGGRIMGGVMSWDRPARLAPFPANSPFAGLPITQNTLDLLEQAGLGRAMFAEVDPNPNEKNLAAGLEAYRSGGHDGVIAFGGGSGLDLGKVVAFMCGQSRPVSGIGVRRIQSGDELLSSLAFELRGSGA